MGDERHQGIVPVTTSATDPVKVLFIISFPRSGSTWVSWLLAQHPAVVACQQLALFHSLADLRDWCAARPDLGANAAPEAGGGASAFSELSRPVVQGFFSRIAGLAPGTKLVVEQTPENTMLLDMIHGVLPDAYFLHVIRDPRSVLCSLRKAVTSWADPRGFPTSPVEISRMWCEYLERGQRLAQKTDRCRALRYEDILADAPKQLESLYSWLSLPADAQFCEQAVERCTIDKLRAHTRSPKNFYRRGQADSWSEEISPSHLRVVEHVAGDAMAAMGYERALPPSRRTPLQVRSWDATAAVVRWLVGGPLRPLVVRQRERARRASG